MGAPDFISGLGHRADRVCAVGDALHRGLTDDERKLVLAIGSGATLGSVIARSGLAEARAVALLLGLRLRGIINPAARDSGAADSPGAAGPGSPRPPAPAGPVGGPERTPRPLLDPLALAEAVDLDEVRKREILELEARCDRDNLFALLGVPVGSEPADVKKAYYELTKRLHPDRYFGKSLGSYKARIEKVFKRITEAQAILSDSARRREYLAQHPELSASRPAGGEDVRSAERRARLARHPYLAKHAKVHEMVANARALMASGDAKRAYSELGRALEIDPHHREASELIVAAKRTVDVARAADLLGEGKSSEKMGNLNAALNAYRQAAALDPEKAEGHFRLAWILLQHGSEEVLKEANTAARRAAELGPANPDHHLVCAMVLARLGLNKNAAREFEAVLKLRPDDAHAKEQLKKLKWKL